MMLVRFLLAALLSLTLSLPSHAQQAGGVALSPQEMRAAALSLLAQGDAPQALAFTQALLSRDPDDLAALLIGAEAAIASDDPATARAYATRAWPLATTPDTRFRAARLAALALSLEGRDTTAQLWLRRAFQDAPNEEARRSAAEDYSFLRARNPLRFQLSGGLRPSSNINGGSSEDTQTFYLFGVPLEFLLSEDAKALAGWELLGQLDLNYRLHETPTSRLSLTFGGGYQAYAFTPSAAARVPDISASDFNRGSVQLGLRQEWIYSPGEAPLTLHATHGRRWFGGDLYTTSNGITFSQPFKLDETSTLTLTADMERTAYIDAGDSARASAVQAQLSRSLDNGVGLSVTAARLITTSETLTRAYTGGRLGVSLSLPDLLGESDLGVSLSHERRTYRASITPDPRRDNTTTLGLNAELPSLEFYGFKPVLSIQASRTDSTVNRYTTRALSTGLTFRSSF